MSTHRKHCRTIAAVANRAGVSVLQCTEAHSLTGRTRGLVQQRKLPAQPVVIGISGEDWRATRLSENKIGGASGGGANHFETLDDRRPERRVLRDARLEPLANDRRNTIDLLNVLPLQLATVDSVEAAVQGEHHARAQDADTARVADHRFQFVVGELPVAAFLFDLSFVLANDAPRNQVELSPVLRIGADDAGLFSPVEHAADGQDVSVQRVNSDSLVPDFADLAEVFGHDLPDFNRDADDRQELNERAFVVLHRGVLQHPVFDAGLHVVDVHLDQRVQANRSVGVSTIYSVLPTDDSLQHPHGRVVIGAEVVVAVADAFSVLAAGLVEMNGELECLSHGAKGVKAGVSTRSLPPFTLYNSAMKIQRNIGKPPPGVEPGTSALQNLSSAHGASELYDSRGKCATASADSPADLRLRGISGVVPDLALVGLRKVEWRFLWVLEPQVVKTYFIYCREANAIKIGVSKDFAKRFSQIQIGCPFDLIPLAIRKGDHEKQLHARHTSSWLRGEWHTVTDELKKVITPVGVEAALALFTDDFPAPNEAARELGEYATASDYRRQRQYEASQENRKEKILAMRAAIIGAASEMGVSLCNMLAKEQRGTR